VAILALPFALAYNGGDMENRTPIEPGADGLFLVEKWAISRQTATETLPESGNAFICRDIVLSPIIFP
jgi:hypothetical protein